MIKGPHGCLSISHHVGHLRVLFRSSPAGNYPGFEANVYCIDSGALMEEGCFPATETPENEGLEQYVSKTHGISLYY